MNLLATVTGVRYDLTIRCDGAKRDSATPRSKGCYENRGLCKKNGLFGRRDRPEAEGSWVTT